MMMSGDIPTLKTLGDYRDFCVMISDENSAAVKFFDDKIAEQGRDQRVLAPESQMMMLIGSLLEQAKTR